MFISHRTERVQGTFKSKRLEVTCLQKEIKMKIILIISLGKKSRKIPKNLEYLENYNTGNLYQLELMG